MAADGLEWFSAGEKWKHVKKDQWLILFLAGVLLLIIAMPAGRKKQYNDEYGEEYTE